MKREVLFILTALQFLFGCVGGVSTYISGNSSKQDAELYEKAKEVAIRYLGNRDLDRYLKKAPGRKALDYGSGLGHSSDFLQKKGFQVTGVDINPDMIHKSQKDYPHITFTLIEKNRKLSYPRQSFDLVLSSFVLFEIPTLTDMSVYLKEAKRVLKKDGSFIAIIGSEEMYNPRRDWGTLVSDYPQNYNVNTGSLVKVRMKNSDLEFQDYYWTADDYKKVFEKIGLNVCQMYFPLGRSGEPYPWKDELKVSPILVIYAAKTCPLLAPL